MEPREGKQNWKRILMLALHDVLHDSGDAPDAAPEDRIALRYIDVPNRYVWKTKAVAGNPDRGNPRVVQSLVACTHALPFVSRLLLLHLPGAESFEHLRRVEGMQHETFRDAARAHGWVQSISEVRFILDEILNTQTPLAKSCELFAYVLVWHDVGDARDVWDNNWRNIAALEVRHGHSEVEVHNRTLRHVELTLEHIRLGAASYRLHYLQAGNPERDAQSKSTHCRELEEYLDYDKRNINSS